MRDNYVPLREASSFVTGRSLDPVPAAIIVTAKCFASFTYPTAIRGVSQEQREAVDKAVAELEAVGIMRDAASSPLVDGNWKLLFTTTPGTASPIQRSFVGVSNFAIYQEIELFSEVSAVRLSVCSKRGGAR